MFIRSILTIAVLASFVFGAAANAGTLRDDARGFTAPGDVAGITREVGPSTGR